MFYLNPVNITFLWNRNMWDVNIIKPFKIWYKILPIEALSFSDHECQLKVFLFLLKLMPLFHGFALLLLEKFLYHLVIAMKPFKRVVLTWGTVQWDCFCWCIFWSFMVAGKLKSAVTMHQRLEQRWSHMIEDKNRWTRDIHFTFFASFANIHVFF